MLLTDLVTLIILALYGVVKYYAPDFPLAEETFLALFLWILTRLGFISRRVWKAIKQGLRL